MTLAVYLAVLLPLVATPRATAPALVLFAIAALYGNYTRRDPIGGWFRLDLITASVLALATWSAVTAIWAPVPSDSLGKCVLLALVVVLTNVAAASGARSSQDVAGQAVRALIVVFVLSAAVVSFETLTNQHLLRLYYNSSAEARLDDIKHLVVKDGVVTYVSDIFLNRSHFVLTFLAVPAWLGAQCFRRASWRLAARSAIAAYLVVMLVASTHESSKLAAVAGCIALALYLVSRRAALLVLAAGWATAVLLVVPIALALGQLGWEKANWLPGSARDRVKVWTHTAKNAMATPIRGHGANATAPLNAQQLANYLAITKKVEPKRAITLEKQLKVAYYSGQRLGPHAHNVFLQTWFELGAAGAVLLTVAGLAMLQRIHRLGAAAGGPFAVQFAAVSAGLATSYGMWQLWLQALIGLSIVLIVIALRSNGVAVGAAAGADAGSAARTADAS